MIPLDSDSGTEACFFSASITYLACDRLDFPAFEPPGQEREEPGLVDERV